jgi:ribonuclease J
MRDRHRLAEDGMIVVVCTMSSMDHTLLSGPEIITRGFVYVKESEELMDEMRSLACGVLNRVRPGTDFTTIKGDIKRELSGYLFRKAKRSPMILPVIMEV